MKLKHTVTAIALVMLITSPTFAREPLSTSEIINRLEESLKDCKWETVNLKGGPLGKMLLHKKTMENVLEALKTGRDVEPTKLDAALKPHAS